MTQSKKGNQWAFRHEGACRGGCEEQPPHTAGVTTDSIHDAHAMDKLIREDDRAVFGDKGYFSNGRSGWRGGGLWPVKNRRKARR